MLPVALTLAPALTTPSALGLPSNFWLLRQEGVMSTAEDQLVAAYISSLRTGDSAAAERDLDALLARPVAVEFEPSGASGAVVELSDGTLMEELNAAGLRSFLLPGRTLAQVEEVDYGAGGLGARVWDASVGLSIWLCRNPTRVRGRAVLELGSGVGLSGVSAALAGAAALTLSDTTATAGEAESEAELGGAALLENLAHNAALNGVAAAAVDVDWHDCLADDFAPHRRFPVVLGAAAG